MRIGSLFSGYGGLDMGVQAVLGGDVVWHSEIDPGACRILAHHWPDVPNLGDISAVDWSTVAPIDVLTGGFPCQDVSHAGRRAGLIRDGEGRTRSGLWGEMLRAVDLLRPALVVAENVRGLFSARADSDVELCPWCVGEVGAGGPMRALGAVLADLADIGYDAAWYGLRAADVGAAHGRFRVFIFAWPTTADADNSGRRERRGAITVQQEHDSAERRSESAVTLLPTPRATDGTKGGPNQRGSSGDLMLPSAVTLLSTPRSSDTDGSGQYGNGGCDLRTAVAEHLLPTPAVNDMGAGKTVEDWDAWTERMKSAHGNGNGHGKSLAIEAQRLLPTPEANTASNGGSQHPDKRRAGGHSVNLQDVAEHLLPTPTAMDHRASGGNPHTTGTHGTGCIRQVRQPDRWGDYGPAIARWAHVIGRPAPDPTEPGPKGNPRLSPAFVEWLMGLPAGHVTDPAIWGDGRGARNAQLRALGNGVVPQQAAAALAALLDDLGAPEVAA